MEKRAGEIVHQEKPYVHVLSSQKRGELCDYCFDSVEKLKTCSSCHVLKYCHRKCQQLDWEVHKLECKCLKNASLEITTDSIRLLLRLLIRHKNGDHEKLFVEDLLWSRPFKDLVSHTSDIKKDEERCQQLHYILCLLPTLVGRCFELPSIDIIWDTFGKMVINSCSIQDKEHKDSLGTAIYLGTSRINHSCDPNAVYTFSGTQINVRAIEYVVKAEPQQLSFSYIDTSRPSWERKKELKQRYYFDCQCPMCTTKCKQVDRLMTSINCPNSDCNGFIGLKRDKEDKSLWPCEKCKNATSTNEEITEFHRMWDESCSFKTELDELFKKGDMKSTLRFAEDKQKTLLKNNFYKCNVNLLEIMDFAMDTCLHLELYEKAAKYTEKVSQGMCQLFPSMNISVGLSFLKLGKLQLYLDRIQEASKSLKVAENILKVTHGSDHMIYKMLLDLQQQCCQLLANQS